MNALVVEPLPVPLRRDDTGAIRVGSSRVSLESVVRTFQNDATPEEIVHAYPTLSLPDVYAVLAWCLTHEDEVERYLEQEEEEAKSIRRKIEAAQPPRHGLRETLLARAKVREPHRDSSGE